MRPPARRAPARSSHNAMKATRMPTRQMLVFHDTSTGSGFPVKEPLDANERNRVALSDEVFMELP
jgi:hypothetical protein